MLPVPMKIGKAILVKGAQKGHKVVDRKHSIYSLHSIQFIQILTSKLHIMSI